MSGSVKTEIYVPVEGLTFFIQLSDAMIRYFNTEKKAFLLANSTFQLAEHIRNAINTQWNGNITYFLTEWGNNARKKPYFVNSQIGIAMTILQRITPKRQVIDAWFYSFVDNTTETTPVKEYYSLFLEQLLQMRSCAQNELTQVKTITKEKGTSK